MFILQRTNAMIRAVNITTNIKGLSLTMASRIVLLVFIRCLALNCNTKRQRDTMKNMESDFVRSRVDQIKMMRKLSRVWTELELKAIFAKAMESFRKIPERLDTVVAHTGATCVICMTNQACSYVIHGDTAHSGFCPSCAMELMLSKAKNCAICRQSVESVVFFAEKGSCSCGKMGCERKIYSTSIQLHSEKTKIVERYSCEEVDLSEFVETLCKVY